MGETTKFNNGYNVPVVGLGTWQSKPGEVKEAVKTAISCGYRHIDCAYLYGNEIEVGEAVSHMIQNGTVKRQELFITSKLWSTHHNPALVEQAFMKSLKDLGLDYLDLYLIHWPMSFQDGDVAFPRDHEGRLVYSKYHFLDAWKVMESLVDKGLVRSIGVSNFNSKQIEKIVSLKDLRHKPVCNQVEISPYFQNERLVRFCKDKDIMMVAYAPLGSPNRPWVKSTDPRPSEDKDLQEIATKYNKSTAQVMLRWSIQRGVIVIPKSVTPSRIRENFQLFDFELTADEMKVIYRLDKNTRTFDIESARTSPEYPFREEF